MINYKEIENKLQDDEIYGKKLKKLKKQKLRSKTLEFIKAIYPHLIGVGLTTTAFCLLGYTPFKRNDESIPLQTKTNIDSFGNENSISEYKDDELPEGTLSYVSKWTKNERNIYERTIKKYDISKMNEEVVKEMVLDNQKTKTLEEVFGKPISTTKETNQNITEEDLNKPDFIEATIYSKDTNEVLKVQESIGSTVAASIAYIVSLILTSFVIFIARPREYLFTYRFEEIDEEYEEKLKDLLREKNSNVKRLERTNIK